MIIKLVYNKEIHLFKLENPVLEQVKNYIKKLHPQINSNYSLLYKDDEGDQISISSDEDLKMLMESIKNQTVKIMIETQNIWACKYCTFENSEGIICGVCCQYKNGEPKEQQFVQQYQECPQPAFYPPLYQQYGNYIQQPPAPPPVQLIPPLGQNPPLLPLHQDLLGMASVEHHRPRIGGFQKFQQQLKNFHTNNNMKWKRFEQLIRDPQLKQQKVKLQQLLKEISKTVKNTKTNQQNQLQQNNWSDMDEQRAKRLAELLQCNQEQAREYLMIFRDLTLDEIEMILNNQ